MACNNGYAKWCNPAPCAGFEFGWVSPPWSYVSFALEESL